MNFKRSTWGLELKNEGFARVIVAMVTFAAIGSVPCRATETQIDSVTEISAAFESLNGSLKSIRERGDVLNLSLMRCADYLDGLGAAPLQMAGKDFQSALLESKKLEFENWSALMELNKPTVTELLLKDSVIRAAMLEIKAQILAINTQISEMSPQADIIKGHAMNLGLAVKAVEKGKNPIAYMRALVQVPLQVSTTVGETRKIAETSGQNLKTSALVLRKLLLTSAILPPTDPLVLQLANVEPAKLDLPPLVEAPSLMFSPSLLTTTLTGATSGSTSDAPTIIPMTPTKPASIVGFWEGLGNETLGRVRLMITAAEVGEVAGFLEIEGTKTRVVLILQQATEDERFFVEAGSENFYSVEMDDNELTLKAESKDRKRLFKVDLTQP